MELQYAPECMIDLETTGTKPGSKILSLGATIFEPFTGVELAAFYATISQESCAAVGLVDDPDTMAWWAKQDNQARMEAFKGEHELHLTLTTFSAWFVLNNPRRSWAQGQDFDFPMLSAAYAACGLVVPWKFWDARDTRTAYEVLKFDALAVTREGTFHNALDDCRHQVICLTKAQRGEAP